MLFDTEHAQLFDQVYTTRGKDYAAEAEILTRLIRDRKPDARSLLDVACGTGEHLRAFKGLFSDVAGLDFTPAMREQAAAKLPGTPIHAGDMSDFELGRTFDAVVCLMSSINFLPLSRMRAAVARMAGHLAPGGVLVVEPWYLPEKIRDRTVIGDVVQVGDGVTIARVSHGLRRDGRHHLDTHFIVADAGGIRHFSDVQVLGIFTREEYESAFAEAGCEVEYDGHGLSGRGLLVAVRR